MFRQAKSVSFESDIKFRWNLIAIEAKSYWILIATVKIKGNAADKAVSMIKQVKSKKLYKLDDLTEEDKAKLSQKAIKDIEEKPDRLSKR